MTDPWQVLRPAPSAVRRPIVGGYRNYSMGDIAAALENAGASLVVTTFPRGPDVIAIDRSSPTWPEAIRDRVYDAFRQTAPIGFLALQFGTIEPATTSRELVSLGMPLHVAMAIDGGSEAWEIVRVHGEIVGLLETQRIEAMFLFA